MDFARDENGRCWEIGLGHLTAVSPLGEPWEVDTIPTLDDDTVDALLTLGPTWPARTLLMYGMLRGGRAAPLVLARLRAAGWTPLCTEDETDMRQLKSFSGVN